MSARVVDPSEVVTVELHASAVSGLQEVAFNGSVVAPQAVSSDGAGQVKYVLAQAVPWGQAVTGQLVLRTVPNWSGTLYCQIAAISSEADPLTGNVVTERTVEPMALWFAGVADAPILAVGQADVTILEDSAAGAHIDILEVRSSDAEGEQLILEVRSSNAAVVSIETHIGYNHSVGGGGGLFVQRQEAGMHIFTAPAAFTSAGAGTLSVHVASDYSGDIELVIAAVVTGDSGAVTTAETHTRVTVHVAGVADVPHLAVAQRIVYVAENDTAAVSWSDVSGADMDGSEALSLELRAYAHGPAQASTSFSAVDDGGRVPVERVMVGDLELASRPVDAGLALGASFTIPQSLASGTLDVLASSSVTLSLVAVATEQSPAAARGAIALIERLTGRGVRQCGHCCPACGSCARAEHPPCVAFCNGRHGRQPGAGPHRCCAIARGGLHRDGARRGGH